MSVAGTRYRRAPRVLWRTIPDGVLVLAPERDAPLRITGPGRSVWAELDSGRTAGELVQLLSSGYQVAPAEVAPVVGSLLEELLRRGIVEEEACPAAT